MGIMTMNTGLRSAFNQSADLGETMDGSGVGSRASGFSLATANQPGIDIVDQQTEWTERRNSMEEGKKELQDKNLEKVAGGVGPTIQVLGPCPQCGKNNATYTINPHYKTIKCNSCGYYGETKMG